MIRIAPALVLILLAVCVACTPRPGTDTAIPPLPVSFNGVGSPVSGKEQAVSVFTVLTDAVGDYPRSPEAWYQRADYHLKTNNGSAALNDIDRAIRLDPNNSLYHSLRASAYQKKGAFELAWESARQAEKLNDQTPEFFRLMGGLLQARKEYAKANQYLDKALEINPSDAEVYYFKAKIAAETGDTARALQGYEITLQQRPDYVETYNRLAEIANASQLSELALDYVRAGLRRDSTNARLYYNGGNAHKAVSRLDSAKRWYAKAVARQPSLYIANFQAGLLYFAEKNYPEARHRFEEVRRFRPQLRRLNYYLGLCYVYTGREREALAQFDTARRADPSDSKSVEQYQKLNWLLVTRRNRRRQDSLNALLPPVRRVPQPIFEPLRPLPLKAPPLRGPEIRKDTAQNR